MAQFSPLITEFEGNEALLTNEIYDLTFNLEDGLLHSIKNKPLSQQISLRQQLFEYSSFNETDRGKCSGWYIFRSYRDLPADPYPSSFPSLTLIQGPIVSEIRQVFSDSVKQIVRLYSGTNEKVKNDKYSILFIHTIGPLTENKEMITRFSSDFETDGLFSTDSQGYMMQERLFNKNATLPIPANYYPITHAAGIKDNRNNSNNNKLTFFTNTPHGVSSQNEGEFEMLLHRRPMQDENGGGTRKPMNDTTTYSPFSWLIFDQQNDGNANEDEKEDFETGYSKEWRKISQELDHRPIIGYAATTNPEDYRIHHKLRFSPLKYEFPKNVHLLSLFIHQQGILAARFEHLYEMSDVSELSNPVLIDLDLFNDLKLSFFEERSLTTVLTRVAAEKQRRNSFTSTYPKDQIQFELQDDNQVIEIQPKDIRTFFLQYHKN